MTMQSECIYFAVFIAKRGGKVKQLEIDGTTYKLRRAQSFAAGDTYTLRCYADGRMTFLKGRWSPPEELRRIPYAEIT